MTWFIIIIAIVIFLIWSFNHDKKEILAKREKKLGSMKKRYNILVEDFTEKKPSNIIKESKDKIVIANRSDDFHFLKTIIEFYDMVEIEFIVTKQNSIFAKRKWQFSLSTDQHVILQRISLETKDLTKNICPLIGKTFRSEFHEEVDLFTNKVLEGYSFRIFFEIEESEIRIFYEDDDEEILSWSFISFANNKYYFKDEKDDSWAINENKFILALSKENKLIHYDVDAI